MIAVTEDAIEEAYREIERLYAIGTPTKMEVVVILREMAKREPLVDAVAIANHFHLSVQQVWRSSEFPRYVTGNRSYFRISECEQVARERAEKRAARKLLVKKPG